MLSYEQIIHFWFSEIEPKSWWLKDPQFDELLRTRFASFHKAAAQAELSPWRRSPEGSLAEIIILDQFSRNMFRGQPQAFAYDGMALVLAQESIHRQDDTKLTGAMRSFLYMPFMHSESKLIHQKAVELFSQPGLESNLEFELKHKVIIDHFGRYPHRNQILNRPSTPEEVEFLKQPNSRF